MGISITPLGGFGEVGRNSVAIDVDGEIVIVDMGIHLERYIELTEDDFTHRRHATRKLLSSQALPTLAPLRRRMRDIKAIVCSHAHLDHIGALPFLAKKCRCPVHATDYTAQVIAALGADRKVEIPTVSHKPLQRFRVSSNIEIEFIHVAHSIPQSALVAVHTPYGVVLYGNDFKNDQSPPFEDPTDMKRFKQLAGKVRVLLLDCLYAQHANHTASELDARHQVLSLEDSLQAKGLVIASTFSSHIYRLRSLCDLADRLGRKVMFLGRSMNRYIQAAQKAGVYDFSSRGDIIPFARKALSFIKNLSNPQDYFLIMTGHQGEPGAMLTRLVAEDVRDLSSDDCVVFSCSVIPSEINVARRQDLEAQLADKNVCVLADVHVSGHAHGKDHRDFITALQPQDLIAAHGDASMEQALVKIAQQTGMSQEKIHRVQVGKTYVFD